MNPNSESGKTIRLRDRLRGETQAAILAAAEHVFAAEGLDRARMESIAARAGVAVGTLYNHFQDREALLAALVGARRDALLQRLDGALADVARRPFEEALGALLCALFEHWAAHRGLLSLLLLHAERPGSIARTRGAILEEVTRRAESLLRRGREEGKVRPDGSGLQAVLLLGMVRGVLLHDAIHQGGGEVGERAGAVLELFLRGAGS